MDPIGGKNPSEPKPSPTPNTISGDVVPPSPAASSTSSAPAPQNTVQPPIPTNLSDFHFEDTQSTPPPSVNPPVSGQQTAAATTVNQTIKTSAKPPKVKQPRSGGAKKALGILAVIILIVGAAAGGYFYGMTVGRDKTIAQMQKESDKAATKAKDTTADEIDDTPGDTTDLVLGEPKTPTYADETINQEIGKQVEANDGLVMKVSSVDRNFQVTDPNYKIETGKELIKVNVLLGNVTKDKAKDITPSNFKVTSSTGVPLNNEVIASFDGKFENLKIEPGKQTKGSIIYKVNKDEKPLFFVREQHYTIATDNKVVTTKISIALTKSARL